MDGKIIDALVRHLSETQGTKRNHRTKQTVPTENQFPALTDHIRGVCKQPRNRGDRQYDGIARELPSIARSMGVTTFDNLKVDDGRDPAMIIENALKYMSQGTESGLVKPFIAWAWEKDAAGLADFMASAKFEAAIDSLIDTPKSIIRPLSDQASTVYDLESLIEQADQRIILVAQNHWHMVSSQGHYWPMIERALARGVDVDLIAMHPQAGSDGEFLKRECGPQIGKHFPTNPTEMWASYLKFPKFVSQLGGTWETFGKWRAIHRTMKPKGSRKIGSLKTYASYFQPNTITVIDPAKRKSIMTVSSRTSSIESVGRPLFLIEKARDPAAFTFFWRYIDDGLSNDVWPLVVESDQ